MATPKLRVQTSSATAGAPVAPRATKARSVKTRGQTPKPRRPAGRRVLLLGDSMIATDFGRALQHLLDADPKVDARRRGKSATGLARPDFFNWTEVARRQLARHRPEAVVVIIGGNDGQDLIDAERKRRRVFWGKPKWARAYAGRLQSWLDLLAGKDREVFWLELPVMARPRLERKLTVIRDVQQRAIEEHPSATWVSTRSWFLKGKALRTEVQLGGKTYPLRQEDGIHFTRPGARWLAEKVAPDLLDRLATAAKD